MDLVCQRVVDKDKLNCLTCVFVLFLVFCLFGVFFFWGGEDCIGGRLVSERVRKRAGGTVEWCGGLVLGGIGMGSCGLTVSECGGGRAELLNGVCIVVGRDVGKGPVVSQGAAGLAVLLNGVDRGGGGVNGERLWWRPC